MDQVLELLEAQRERGLHDGAQVYVSRHGKPLLDAAVGESTPGRDLQTDDVMLWYSSSKPVTAAAVMQLWERGNLDIDDPVARYIDGWGAGKERCTIRQVLTHTGGFPMLYERLGEADLDLWDKVAQIAAHPAEWEPGTKASYHLTTGWTVLGAVVEVADGRPVGQYVAEEIFEPAGMTECSLAVPVERQAELGDRLVPMRWKGHTMPARRDDGRLDMVPYDIEERGHNEPWYRARVEPGSSVQGPARQLGRFYEALIGQGAEVLERRTAEVMIATQRSGMRDAMFGNLKLPWGLGVQVSGSISGGVGPRTFGHGGMGSSRAIADPDAGLVMAVITNGLPAPLDNEQRFYELTDTVYTALDDPTVLRRPHRPPVDSAYSS